MNFDLDEGQRLLQDSLRKWTDGAYGFEARQAIAQSPLGRDPAIWSTMTELGLHGLPFSEAEGGFGGGPVEILLVMEAIGRALVTEPWATSVLLVGAILRHGRFDDAAAARRAELIAQIVAGEVIVAPALNEALSRWSLGGVRTEATRTDAGWRLDGDKGFIMHGASADRLLVSAKAGGSSIGLFLVDADAAGLSLTGYATQDGGRAADVRFQAVPAELLLPDALPVIERAVDEATAALCAEAVGAMDEALRMTVDYLKTRVQFGQPIGSFQALQHRAADMFVAIEQARSLSYLAMMSAGEDDGAARARAVSAAKIQIGKSGRFVGQEAVQLHGGIGVTWEYKLGHLFKRLTVIDKQFGDVDWHLDRLSALGGLYGAEGAA